MCVAGCKNKIILKVCPQYQGNTQHLRFRPHLLVESNELFSDLFPAENLLLHLYLGVNGIPGMPLSGVVLVAMLTEIILPLMVSLSSVVCVCCVCVAVDYFKLNVLVTSI